MIAASELREIPIFACLDEPERQRLAERAADVRLEPGEWLIREGEVAYFFVLMEGRLQLLKDILGQSKDFHEYKAGDFFGEVPILLGAPAFVSIRATLQSSRGTVRCAGGVRADPNVCGVQCLDFADDDRSADVGTEVCKRDTELSGATGRHTI